MISENEKGETKKDEEKGGCNKNWKECLEF